jgi:hypothetical protein
VLVKQVVLKFVIISIDVFVEKCYNFGGKGNVGVCFLLSENGEVGWF